MTREYINPPELGPARGYTHVVRASGEWWIFVSGQVASDERGEIIGRTDLRAQAERAFRNLGAALAAAGARFEDVVKLTIYIVGATPEAVALVREVRRQFFRSSSPPASTLVGVQSLAREGALIEIEAIALLEGAS